MYSTNNPRWRQKLNPYNQYEEERAPNLDNVFSEFMAYHASSKANHNAIQKDYQGEPELQFYYQNEAKRGFNLDTLLMQCKDTIGSIQRVGKLVKEVTQVMGIREEEFVEVEAQEGSLVKEHDLEEERHEDHEVPIILGQPCLSIASCVLGMGKGKLELNVEDQKISFDLFEAMKHSDDSEALMQSYPARALDRRLQVDWARDPREGPRALYFGHSSSIGPTSKLPSSRKRKSTASRPQAQYDTRRFHSLDAWNRYIDNILGRNILSEKNVQIYHTEFDEFKVELERHGSIDLAMVKEFYANLYTTKEQAPKQARVRGHLIKIDADSLNEFLQMPMEIEARLYIPRKGVFSYSNLAPTPHTSDLNMDRARLVYGLVTNMDMNIGALISGQISSIAQSNSFRLGFPALITALCGARGVTSDINFRGARKARVRPADVPSSSTLPAPSNSTTPTPAHLGSSTQDSQCFEAMLQSIHQGQILLLQSLQVIAPPRSILSVEQFIEKVSWPGTLPFVVREGEGPNPQVPQQGTGKAGGCYFREITTDFTRSTLSSDPSTPLLDLPEDPSTPVLGLTTTPLATPVLHLADEEGTQDQETQQDDQSLEF
ncbi:hypothetical protein HKD37_05G012591 [Glycine soja]